MTDAESEFAVEIEGAEDTVEAGATLTVSARVENEADTTGDGTVQLLDPTGDEADDTDVELGAGETETVELEWTPGEEDTGDAEVTVETETDVATAAVTVEEAPASFAVTIDSADEHLPVDGIATVSATVENTGTLEGSQVLEIAVDGERTEARTLSLAGGESETVEFSYRIQAEDLPDVTLAISSDDDSDETDVTVVTRSVTPGRTFGSKSGMGPFGWAIFILMAILLIPLLPLLVLLKVLDVLLGRGDAVR